MCLKSKTGIIEIADKDIIVYKRLYKEYEWFRSIHFNKKYQLNELNEMRTDLMIDDDGDVYHGFHSWKYPQNKPNKLSSQVVLKCLIPKGSQIISGIQHDRQDGFVSNKIIILEQYKNSSNLINWFIKNIDKIKNGSLIRRN